MVLVLIQEITARKFVRIVTHRMLYISPSQNLQIKQRKIIINFYGKQETLHLNFYVFIEFSYYGFLFVSSSAENYGNNN
jgi:hypothetical protein